MRGVGVVGFLLPPSQTKPLARSAESGIAGAQVHEGSVYPEPTARTPYPSPLPHPTPPHPTNLLPPPPFGRTERSSVALCCLLLDLLTAGSSVPLDRPYPWCAHTLVAPVPLVRPYPWIARTHIHERPAHSTPGWEPGLTR